MRLLLLHLALPLAVSLGCPSADDDDSSAGDDDATADDDDSTAAGPWDDGQVIEITVDGQPMIEGSFDGAGPIWWALDTGAARTYVDAEITGTTNNVIGDVVVGPLSFPEHQVGSVELDEAEAFIGWDLGGLAGQDVFADRFVALDYGAARAHFLDDVPAEPPPGVLDGDPGETGYTLPASIPVGTFGLGGATDLHLDLIADTGSGVTLLLESAYDAIRTDAMPRLDGYVWATNYGSDEGFLTRLPWLGEADGWVGVEGSWAVVIPDDNHLWPLLQGNGIDADGFVGYPYYRRFVVGVDGHADRYLWWPLADDAHVDASEWTRVGVEPTWRDGGFTVEMVYRPSDAHDRGVVPGDRIVAVDGQPLTDTTLDELKRMLRGTPGDVRGLSLQRGDTALELDVAIDDLLPAL